MGEGCVHSNLSRFDEVIASKLDPAIHWTTINGSRHSGVIEIDNIPGHKWCFRCNELKKCDEFYKNPQHKSGFSYLCKSCHYNDYLSWKDKVYTKVMCTCGKTIYKYYMNKHLDTNIHKKLVEIQPQIKQKIEHIRRVEVF